MAETFTVILEQGEDGYFLSEVPELPGCRSQAKTYDELLKRTRAAIELYLEVKGRESRTKFLGIQQLEVEV